MAKIYMNGKELCYENEIKLLGVIIDKNLKFISHVKYAINKAYKIYKKLCLFVRPTWGVHSENVRTIYKHVIEPIITYAAGIWGSATKYKTVIDQLRSIQRSFALKIIRAFRTVSATAAIALSELIPLHLKVNEVAAIENTKWTKVTDFLPDDIILEKPEKPGKLLHPADRKRIKLNFATTQTDIDNHCPDNYVKIFTDGSKHSENKVGAAFVAFKPDGTKTIRKFKLHSSCSVYQAELLAIDRACEWALKNNIANYAILSDSQSSLSEINNKDSTNPTVVSIHKHMHTTFSTGGDIIFIWTKAHTGLVGNEAADVAAKAAAESRSQYACILFPISFVKYHLKRSNWEAAEEIYLNSPQGQHTRNICPKLEDIRNLWKATKPTFELTQILTGHGYHLQYLHRFKIKNTNSCPCDDFTEQTIQHLIEKCPRFLPVCLRAFVCPHDGKRVCGINPYTKEVRRFLDKCDILEFNCEYKTNFKVTGNKKCKHVPHL
ncbi:RNase H domain-containing protein [Phthorimaea operculella]|nr:RNase H domain-containing protein [Phthorimaea operculella]